MGCKCCQKAWGLEDIGDLKGKNIIVTGGNSGLGFYTALALGEAGAEVIIACRDKAKGQEALEKLQKSASSGLFKLEILDLADQESIANFANRFLALNKPLDILVNNAGVMAPPKREVNTKGFELQFATNHLGHFALTGLLLPALKQSQKPRVVVVSSLVAFWGKINFNDLQSNLNYNPMQAYGQSKLANLEFMLYLGKKAPWLTCVAAHPGVSITNLQRYSKFSKIFVQLLGQEAEKGALPTLLACVDDVSSGTFYGPKGCLQFRGTPKIRKLPCRANNIAEHEKLWAISEDLTKIKYDFS